MNLVFLRHQFLVCAALAVALIGAGYGKPAGAWRSFIDETYSLYSASDWEPKLHYPHNATNGWWDVSLVPVPPAGCFVHRNLHPDVDVENISWRSGSGITNAHGHIHVQKGDSFSDAIWLIMSNFADSSAPHPFPRATGVCTNIGDICYTGYPPGSAKCLDFIRNNIYVSISSTDENWTTNTAFAIDAAILNASTNTPSGSWLQRMFNKL